jgi:hypothetical protein
MTPAEYLEHLSRLGLTQEAAGEFFGASKRTGQRWAAEGPPLVVAALLRSGLSLDKLDEMLG